MALVSIVASFTLGVSLPHVHRCASPIVAQRVRMPIAVAAESAVDDPFLMQVNATATLVDEFNRVCYDEIFLWIPRYKESGFSTFRFEDFLDGRVRKLVPSVRRLVLRAAAPATLGVRWAEAALRPVPTIAVSNFHSHVIGHAGTLYTWGGDGEGGEEEGTIGPIGVGERREPTLHPEEIVEPPAFRNLRSIVTAVNHALCVDHDGNVWSWGSQLVKNGQLGHPDMKPRWRPAKILAAAGEELPRILQAAAGDDFSLLLRIETEI